MAASEGLYNLIGTLSKTEKRYCTMMFASGTGRRARSCRRLFALLCGLRTLNEEAVRMAVANEPFAGHLAVTKNHLYEHLLRSLSTFNTANEAHRRIRLLIEGAEVLTDRGLHEQASERLHMARELAERHECLPEQLTIARLECSIDTRTCHANTTPEQLSERRSRIETILANVADYWDSQHLYGVVARELMQHGPGAAGAEQRLGRAACKGALEPAASRTETARLIRTESQRLYHLLAADHAAALLYSDQCIRLAESYPMKERAQRFNYSTLLFTHVMLAMRMGRNAEARSAFEKLCAIEPSGGIDAMHLRVQQFSCRLELLMVDFEHEAIAAMADEFEAICVNSEDGLARQLRLGYPIELAYAQFVNGCLGDALSTLHPLINDARPGFRDDALCAARLLRLMIHYDSGNLELLPYLIRSTYGFIARCRGVSDADRAVLRFMRRLPNICTQEELRSAFARAYDELAAIAANRDQVQGTAIVCILPWLRSTITGRPFGEVAREARRAMIAEDDDGVRESGVVVAM
ncbi:MAG TPA: hypothetical protein VHI13_22460 [Candidatus Kapabacteria bacterium]|nr:hypothetical protein [Candidatus Kapabacteria bacterium]